MSMVDEGHDRLRRGSKKRVCNVSHEQQAILVGLVFKSSRWSTDENEARYRGTRLHCKSMPLTFSVKELELTSSDLRKIIPHNQPNVEQIEPEVSVPVTSMETTTHSVPIDSQSVIRNPADTTNSLSNRGTPLPVSKVVSSNLTKIIPHNQPNIEQIDLEPPVSASSSETITHPILSSIQSLTEDPSNTVDSPMIQETPLSVTELDLSNLQNIIACDQSNIEHVESEVIVTTSLEKTTTHPVSSNSQSLTRNSTDTVTSPPTQKPLFPVAEHESSNLHYIINHDQPNIEHIESEVIVTTSLEEMTPHPVSSNSQTLTGNSTSTATLPPTQKLLFTVPERESLNLHNIATHNQPKEPEALISALLMETDVDPIPSNSQSLTDNVTGIANSSPNQETDFPVSDTLSLSLNSSISKCIPGTEILPNLSVDDTANRQTCMSSYPSNIQIQWNTQYPLPTSLNNQIQILNDEDGPTNMMIDSQEKSDTQILVPASSSETLFPTPVTSKNCFVDLVDVAYESLDTCDKKSRVLDMQPIFQRRHSTNDSIKDMAIVKAARSQKRKSITKCQCPNCIADVDNRIKGPRGNHKHICHLPDCRKIFNNTRTLNKHLAWHRNNKFMCADCRKGFNRKTVLREHIRAHKCQHLKCKCPNCSIDGGNKTRNINGELLHKCHFPDCAKSYTRIHSLKRHLGSHIPKENFIESKICQCPNCSVDGGNKTRNLNGELLHKCHFPGCEKVLTRVDRLERHLGSHIPKKNFIGGKKCQCPNCSVDGGNKTRNLNGELLHKCQFPGCKKVFTRVDKLERHLGSHIPKKNFIGGKKCQCPNCSVDGGNKTRNVKGVRLHKCHFPDCGKTFTRTNSLKAHLDKHSNETKFYCADCHKGFTSKNTLRDHIRTHTNGKQAEYEYPNSSVNDVNHINNPSGRPLHKCHFPDCGKVFMWSHNLKRHLDYHSGKKNFLCELCNEEFTCEDKLSEHIRSHINN